MRRQLHCFLLFLSTFASAQPLFDSWHVAGSRNYARVYQTLNDETARTAATTWNRGQGVQSQPTYAGVHLVAYNDNNVYIGATGLGSHIMGPWYGNAQKTQLFPNYPAARSTYFRITRNPVIPATKSLTGLGAIGVFVDGVSMFDSRDAFSYSNSNGADASPGTSFQGDGIWNRDAFVNESVTFDAANAHQAGPTYHYHANPPGLRFQLGDNVAYDAVNNRYTEGATPAKHSPILGWVIDGLPIYGPYGYSDAMDTNSPLSRMRSGFRMRDIAVRETLPAWAARYQNRAVQLAANQFGPTAAANSIGHYLEDYEYLGDIGQTLGVDFDLNENNVRFCKTPEFPEGTWAYFVSIEADGTPKFPYNIGRSYYGTPNGGSINSLPANATVHARGGPESSPRLQSLSRGGNGDVTLVWDGVEGGRYRVESSSDFSSWTPLLNVEGNTISDPLAGFTPRKFYRTSIDSVAPFANSGFQTGVVARALQTINVTLSGSAPGDLNVRPSSVSFNGGPAFFVARPSQNVLTLRIPEGTAPGGYAVAATFSDGSALVGTHQVVTGNNILLLIVDDWGIDSSPVDNVGGSNLPIMPNLQTLAGSGVRFRHAYAQSQCSPTRAAILSGRHAFRTGVGSPAGASFLASEISLAEALSANAGYAVASVGKWHLGGGDTGPRDRGGWQYFAGSSGNLTNYNSWQKLTINGAAAPVTTTSTTYATTDNTTDAINWINAQGANDWFCWVAYNAPHSPFEHPPTVVAGQTNPYSTGGNNRRRYEAMLWAMDAEIGRLLSNVDLNSTTVIIIGDNGTPGGVIQAPFDTAHSKGTLFNGGTHVPLVIAGKAAQNANTTSDADVHAVDLYSTILEIAGVNPASLGVTLDSQSLLPILSGTADTANRFAVAEAFGTDTNPGRAIRKDDYKLIIHDDPLITTDTAVLELYHLPTDQNETNNLLAGTLTATQQTAFNNLLAKNVALGGNFNNTPAQPITFFAQLDQNATPQVPALTRNNNGTITPIIPQNITVGGAAAVFVARKDQAGADARYWVEATIEPGSAGLQSGQSYPIVVTFPGQTPRVFNALNQFVAP